ncbi:MAG TPA: hypothetical protein VKA10_06145 [Prolixibacteraceae bacterium]|nr:hypothetical protein [Prolixibacteraceae bacterium]
MVNKLVVCVFGLLTLTYCNAPKKEKVKSPLKSETSNYSPRIFTHQLPRKLSENSALIIYNNLIWTCNDSGGKAKIYGLSRDGEIKEEIRIKNATNNDWEDITQDEQHIYVGDFGNNSGNRDDLKIYKIEKTEMANSSDVEAEIIQFSYSDQKENGFKLFATSFDCEALADINGKLFLFLKDWQNETTTIYHVPKTKGTFKLDPMQSLNIGTLITGADFCPNNNMLALIGYHDHMPVLHIFKKVSRKKPFGEEHEVFSMESITGAQTEGVCFLGNDTLLFSCERTSKFPARIFLSDLKKLLNDN